jgi:hypothetical protein
MTAPDLTPVPLPPERLAEIRSTLLGDWLAGGWRVRSVPSDDSRDRSEVFLPGAPAEDTVIATFPDWADPVAVFLADAHEAVPELLAEVDRLRAKVGDRNATIDRLSTQIGELEASLPSRFASTPLQVEQHLTSVLAEDVHLRYQQAVGSYAVGEAAKSLRMDANLRQLEGNHEEAAEARELANLIDPLRGGGPYPSTLVRFGCGAEATS